MKGRKAPGGIVIVREDLFELEIDKVLGIKRTDLLLWLAVRVGVEVEIGCGRDGADAKEDEREIGGGLLRGRCREGTGQLKAERRVRECAGRISNDVDTSERRASTANDMV